MLKLSPFILFCFVVLFVFVDHVLVTEAKKSKAIKKLIKFGIGLSHARRLHTEEGGQISENTSLGQSVPHYSQYPDSHEASVTDSPHDYGNGHPSNQYDNPSNQYDAPLDGPSTHDTLNHPITHDNYNPSLSSNSNIPPISSTSNIQSPTNHYNNVPPPPPSTSSSYNNEYNSNTISPPPSSPNPSSMTGHSIPPTAPSTIYSGTVTGNPSISYDYLRGASIPSHPIFFPPMFPMMPPMMFGLPGLNLPFRSTGIGASSDLPCCIHLPLAASFFTPCQMCV